MAGLEHGSTHNKGRQRTSSQTGQVTSPTFIGHSIATQESPTITASLVAPIASLIAPDRQLFTDKQRFPSPSPYATDADIFGLDPIAKSATKDDEWSYRRIFKRMEELNKIAERGVDLGHNAQGGTISMPDISHDQAIPQAVREVLEGTEAAKLRNFQETSMKMNQIITVSGVVTEHHMLTQVSGNTRSNESS